MTQGGMIRQRRYVHIVGRPSVCPYQCPGAVSDGPGRSLASCHSNRPVREPPYDFLGGAGRFFKKIILPRILPK